MTRNHFSAVWAGSLLIGLGFGPQQEVEQVIEPGSKRAFPVQLQVPTGQDVHTLVGTGLRTKTIFAVQVYAFGLYVDAPAAGSALQEWTGRSAKELEKDAAFYEELLKENFGKTLRLVMTRNVNGKDMAEAFEDALGPRVTRAAEELEMPGREEALQEFRNYFDVEKLTKETELVFTWLPQGTLVTSIQGEVAGEIRSAALCWALFDVYLGAKPISKGGKKSLIARFPQVLAGLRATPGS